MPSDEACADAAEARASAGMDEPNDPPEKSEAVKTAEAIAAAINSMADRVSPY